MTSKESLEVPVFVPDGTPASSPAAMTAESKPLSLKNGRNKRHQQQPPQSLQELRERFHALSQATQSAGLLPSPDAAAAAPAPAAAPAQAAQTPAPAPTPNAQVDAAPAPAQTPAAQTPATGEEARKAATNDDYKPDDLLLHILSTKRAYNSKGDTAFRLWLFNWLSREGFKPVTFQPGNIFVSTDEKSTVLFSCHTDTVHNDKESNTDERQKLAFDPAFGHIFLNDKQSSSCLGGDDGCGIYIMLKMLKAGVKAKFMFHVGEERGGIGAKAFVASNKPMLEDLEMVVAFDRPVYDNESPEVIATQGGRRCASNEFAEALAKALNEASDFDKPYVISHRGVYTDSKEYAADVPECVNLGVFYNKQHTANEYVDVYGLEKLVEAAIKIDWKKLPIVRKPEPDQRYGGYQYGGGKHMQHRFPGMDEEDGYVFGGGRFKPNGAAPAPAAARPPAGDEATLARLRKAYQAVDTHSLEDLNELDSVDDWIAFIEDDIDRAALLFMELFAENESAQRKLSVYRRFMKLGG